MRLLSPAVLGRVALVALVVAGACGDDAEGPSAPGALPLPDPGAVLYQVPGEDGDVAPGLEVVDTEGGEPESITADRLQGGVATVAPARALYAAAHGSIVLVDADRARATPLDIPAEVAAGLDPTYVNSSVQGGGRRFVLLTGPLGGTAVLVDLADGTSTDLGPILDDAEFFAAAEFDAEETLLVVETDRGLWLVPTDSPASARLVDDETFGGDLSDDGERLVYSQARDASDRQILVLDLETEETTGIAGGPDLRFAGFVGDQVLIEREGTAALLDLESGEETTVLEQHTADVRPIRSGDRAVVGVGQEGAERWFLVTADGEAQELEAVAGQVPRPAGRAPRWVPFVDANTSRQIQVLDLDDGDVTEVLSLGEDDEARIVEGPSVSPDGRYALIRTQAGDEIETVLADFEDGEVEVVGSQLAGASFAPDGSRLVLSRLTDPQTGEADLVVVPVEDPNQEGETIGTGLFPLWVPAAAS